jgi:hypothetical protein
VWVEIGGSRSRTCRSVLVTRGTCGRGSSCVAQLSCAAYVWLALDYLGLVANQSNTLLRTWVSVPSTKTSWIGTSRWVVMIRRTWAPLLLLLQHVWSGSAIPPGALPVVPPLATVPNCPSCAPVSVPEHCSYVPARMPGSSPGGVAPSAAAAATPVHNYHNRGFVLPAATAGAGRRLLAVPARRRVAVRPSASRANVVRRKPAAKKGTRGEKRRHQTEFHPPNAAMEAKYRVQLREIRDRPLRCGPGFGPGARGAGGDLQLATRSCGEQPIRSQMRWHSPLCEMGESTPHGMAMFTNSACSRGRGGGLVGEMRKHTVWKAATLESRAKAAARLDLEVSTGWMSPSSRGLWGGDALLISTGAAGS